MEALRMLSRLSVVIAAIAVWIVAIADFRQVETIREYKYIFTVSGGASNTFIDISQATTGTTQLPLYSTVEEVTMKVVEPITPSTGVSLTIGNSVSAAGYLRPRDVSSFSDNAVIIADGGFLVDQSTGLRKSMIVSGANDRDFGLKVSSGTTLTGGKVIFKVKSYQWSED